MATSFPTGLDSFTNPTSTDTMATVSHADQHADVNDAVAALEAKVGIDSSAVTSSLDYRISQIESTGAAGSDGQVQYNNGGAVGGASALVYDDVNGRVGVGLTPGVELEVAGTIKGTDLIVSAGATVGGSMSVDTDTLYVDSSNDRVGVGTTSPISTLSISGTNTSTVPIVDIQTTGSGGYQRGVRLLNSGLSSGEELLFAVGQADSARNMGQVYFAFTSSNSTSNRLSLGLHAVDDVLNIMGSGNVGIGTTSPAAKLHVSGEIVHASQWAGCAGPTSWASAYINNWSQARGEGSFMTASSTGITINRSGRYYVWAGQRCNSTSDTYIGIAENGNRATLDSRTTGIWSHDHAGYPNTWTMSHYVGYLAAGEKLTSGAVNSTNASYLLFASNGYAGFLTAIWLGD